MDSLNVNATSSLFESAGEDMSTYFNQFSSDNEEEEEKPCVKFTTQMESGPGSYKEIEYDCIDTFNFNKQAFIEVVQKPAFVHFYIDSDAIETREEYEDFYNWLLQLKSIFGNFSIGGYTTNDKLFGDLYKYQPQGNHTLSLHVVFYETKIKADVLVQLMKQKNGKYVYDVNKFCDANVYKLKTEQKMRHVLSDKIFKDGSKKNKQTKGSFLDEDTKPSQSIITIRGDEKMYDEDKFNEFFKFGEAEPEPVKEVVEKPKRSHHKKPTIPGEEKQKPTTILTLEHEDKLILLDAVELKELLDNFENNTNTILCTLGPLWHSPYSKEFLINTVSEWYEQAEHTHPENVENFINRYYEREDSNKWFFSLIKKLNENVRADYKTKYVKNNIDWSININNSNITYNDIKHRSYSLMGFVNLLNDLRGCVGVVDDKWYLKTTQSDEDCAQKIILCMNDEKLMKKLKTFKPFRGNNSINLYQIVQKFSNYFMYDGAKMENENHDNIINMFQGYKHTEIITDDYKLIEPFLNHIKHIICKDNEKKYEYFMQWYANIIQNITVKNGTMPIVWGAQGSGKSIAVETFCELLGHYALSNVDDLDKVFGKFNGLIGQHLIININEPPNSDEKFKFTGKIKSKLTQKKHIQETKGIDSIEIDSYANYCITTNNPSPVQEEKGDRRLIYFEVNNEKVADEKYFNDLMQTIQPVKQGPYNPEFMGVLLHYMKTQVDVSDFNPERLIREINSDTTVAYNENLERQYEALDAVERFVVDNYKEFIDGLNTDQIALYTNNGHFPGYKLLGVQKKLNSICDVSRKIIDGHKIRIYKLKDEKQIPDLYNIIKYQHHDDPEEKQDDINKL